MPRLALASGRKVQIKTIKWGRSPDAPPELNEDKEGSKGNLQTKEMKFWIELNLICPFRGFFKIDSMI